MNKEKNIQIKFVIDSNTNSVFRRILKIKKSTIQSIMEKLLKDYLFDNLDTIIKSKLIKNFT